MSITSQRVFAIHSGHDSRVSLSTRVQQLLADQQRSWRDLAEGYDALRAIKTRIIDCAGFSVTLQFNPRRITSTSARVDDQSVKMRKCFLCLENLPDDQRGILYHSDFLILCNPAPIFDGHFTVSHVKHTAQSIEAYPGIFLELARDLSPVYTIFYNGPKCGASAPDHMHFQACPSNVLSIEAMASDNARRVPVKKEGGLFVATLRDGGRQVIVIESTSKDEIERALGRLLGAMRTTLGVAEEPMINVLCTFRDSMWRLIIFPRSKHRPDVYFRQGNDRVMISPAAVDLGGLIITPLEKDFLAVDARLVEAIFREVSLEATVVRQILDVF